MSQYVDIKVKVTSLPATLAALKTLGLNAECDATGKLRLETYNGSAVSDSACHVKVDRGQLGGGNNDFGVNLGTGQVWMCDYAQQDKLSKFLQEYSYEVTKQHYADQGKYVYRQEDPVTGNIHVYVNGG